MKKTKLLTLFPLVFAGSLSACANNAHANVGLLYCSSEANSKYQVDVVKAELENKGLSTKLISFTDSNDLATILRGQIGNVDSLYIPTDNQCASNTEIINTIVKENKKPVFAGEENICSGCGAITLSISYYNIGVKTGKMAVDVLLGKQDISTLPIAYDENPVKEYNKSFCEAMDITVPSDYVAIGEGKSVVASLGSNQNTNNTKFTVGICQLVTHDALDAATRGFMDAVKAGLGEDNVTFDLQNAAGEANNCTTIVGSFVSKNVSLIMANATPALQAAANATKTIPVLGTSVTEYGTALNIPDFKGVVGGNISGTSDLAPLSTQAQMLNDVFAPFFKK